MTVQEVVTLITANPGWAGQILPVIQESDAVKNLITNKADLIYKEKIDEEVKNIHSRYDEDMFEILGERPGMKDGNKQKTYDKMKDVLTELKGLRGQKDSLSKDAKVVELQAEIDKLKAGEGYTALKETHTQAQQAMQSKIDALQEELDGAKTGNLNFKKETSIAGELAAIKFAPGTPESVQKMVKDSAKAQLMQNSEFDNEGNLVFKGEDGKTLINQTTFKPMTAGDVLNGMEAIKDVSLKEDQQKGGGADTTIKGQIVTTTVEGKDTKKLNLPKGSIKTKTQFITEAEKALLDSGVTRHDKEWDTLKNEAYREHGVGELPLR